ncbi:MAG: histidine--tRNA ligase [Propionibacteriaceae bacterium]|jgi:histidyl-tRNA synthetase|nr:histidine--tRNA ligase [Propionibacteriaceae bacterium]
MTRPAPLSGFPEWLPAGRLVEQQILDSLRQTFELHGFAPVETRAVEPLADLLRKGETSKEVYVLSRLQDQFGPDERADGKRLGLRFDLTVPFARYVLEHAGRLDFPFKRYQIQKVWRGERPQEGRFREFYQADIDVVGQGSLPFHYEVELPLVMAEALARLPIGRVQILANNRKLSEGFYRGLGLEDIDAVLRAIDKLDKIGPAAVADLLAADSGAGPPEAAACLELAAVSGTEADQVTAAVTALAGRYGVANALLDEGLAELAALLEGTAAALPGAVAADLKIARGLDYYTGTVYESVLFGQESLGSVCSGGRYDSLASDGAHSYPGVGLSVGVSRLVSRLLGQFLVGVTRPTPTAVLVAVADEASRLDSEAVARALRARGIPADVAPTAARFGKQIRHADRRSIPYVWFPAADGAPDEVKDIRSGDQTAADPASWRPPEDDLWPRLTQL